MICYICSKKHKEIQAVAVCIVCGMGLCDEHLIREELPVWEKLQTGMAETRRKLPETLPRFVCPPCHQALHQTED